MNPVLCPSCGKPLTEVRTKTTGVCPTHGVTPVVCGDPECWCADEAGIKGFDAEFVPDCDTEGA